MTVRGPTDALPGNLSDQQLFVLAVLANEHDPERDRSRGVSYRRLSWAAAEEFDDDGTHIHERTFGYRRRVLTGDHAASFSRTVKRLEERGYLERQTSYGGVWDDEQTKSVLPTGKGLRAGREAIRRHQDGRYSVSFDTLDADA